MRLGRASFQSLHFSFRPYTWMGDIPPLAWPSSPCGSFFSRWGTFGFSLVFTGSIPGLSPWEGLVLFPLQSRAFSHPPGMAERGAWKHVQKGGIRWTAGGLARGLLPRHGGRKRDVLHQLVLLGPALPQPRSLPLCIHGNRHRSRRVRAGSSMVRRRQGRGAERTSALDEPANETAEGRELTRKETSMQGNLPHW